MRVMPQGGSLVSEMHVRAAHCVRGVVVVKEYLEWDRSCGKVIVGWRQRGP